MEDRLLHRLRKEKDEYLTRTFEPYRKGAPRLSFLAHAIRMNMGKVAKYLIQQRRHEFNLDETFDSGDVAVRYALLHHAVMRRMVTVVEALIEKGADTLKQNAEKQTPLELAVSLLRKLPPQSHDRPKVAKIIDLLDKNTANESRRRNTEGAQRGSDPADVSAVRRGR